MRPSPVASATKAGLVPVEENQELLRELRRVLSSGPSFRTGRL